MKFFRRRPSPAAVLALLALFVALGGSAYAASDTFLSSNVPKTPFRAYAEVYDVSAVFNNVLIPPTTATVAVDRITLSTWLASSLRKTVLIYQFDVGIGQPCTSPSSSRPVAVYELGPSNNVLDEPTTPLVLKPQTTAAWCLVANQYPGPSSDGIFSYANLTGFVVKGTLSRAAPTASPPTHGGQPGAPAQITSG